LGEEKGRRCECDRKGEGKAVEKKEGKGLWGKEGTGKKDERQREFAHRVVVLLLLLDTTSILHFLRVQQLKLYFNSSLSEVALIAR